MLAAATAALIIAGTRTLFSPPTRWLDLALVAFVAGALLQAIPLPSSLIDRLSPSTARVASQIELRVQDETRPLSIDARATRSGVASALAAILVFWAARASFQRGGVRLTSRVLATSAGIAALVGLAQQVSSPRLLLWTWEPIDSGARPFGPFVNPNNFGSWLLMALSAACGYLVAHIRTHRLTRRSSTRLRLHALLADGTTLVLVACIGLMAIALFATGSRGAVLSAIAAAATGLWLARATRTSGSLAGAATGLAVLLGASFWINAERMASRIEQGSDVSRLVIHRESLPLVADFPLAGTGLGTYAQSMLVYQQSRDERIFNHAHNEYLQLLTEGGALLTLPAVVALIAWIGIVRRQLRREQRELAWIRIGALAGIAGVATHCLFESTLRLPANAMLLALLAALATHEGHRISAHASPASDASP